MSFWWQNMIILEKGRHAHICLYSYNSGKWPIYCFTKNLYLYLKKLHKRFIASLTLNVDVDFQ